MSVQHGLRARDLSRALTCSNAFVEADVDHGAFEALRESARGHAPRRDPDEVGGMCDVLFLAREAQQCDTDGLQP